MRLLTPQSGSGVSPLFRKAYAPEGAVILSTMPLPDSSASTTEPGRLCHPHPDDVGLCASWLSESGVSFRSPRALHTRVKTPPFSHAKAI